MRDMHFFCSYCRRSLVIDANGAGSHIVCPACGNRIAVPPQASVTPAPRPLITRPPSVTVFGILNIVFGGLGLLCSPLSMLALFAVPDAVSSVPAYKAWQVLACLIGLALTVWLLALGIGLLNLTRWARTGSIAYGWLSIMFAAVGVTITCAAIAEGGVTAEELPGLVGGLCGGLIGFVYPILLIVMMDREPAIASCIR